MDIEIIMTGFFGILGIIGMSAFGVPIGISLGSVALLGIYYTAGSTFALVTLRNLPYSMASSYSLVVIPMFILMGLIASEAGMMTDLYNSLNKWLARFKGALLMVTTAASAAFGAVSGSSVVNAAVFTRIAFPEMVRLGYKPGVGAAAIASAGTLASLIPPSINFVIFAILTEESIGQLLLAGLFPGILTTIIYIVGIAICVRIFKDWAPESVQRYTMKEKVESLRNIWPVMLIAVIIVGGIYSGITPPSAAGGVGAISVIIVVWIQRRMTRGIIWNSLKQTVEITATLSIIVFGGMMFSRFLAVSGFVEEIVTWFETVGLEKYQFLLLVVVIFLILGMFMDTMSILVITTPVLFPIVQVMDINVIWYAVIIVKLMEIAVVSPPVGINLFVVLAATDEKIKIGDLYKGVLPFIIFDLITIGLIILFPAIATWMPETMM
ncbi:MAG: TRAP transporter large permease [Deltaproteobacteria bacterium]|jgi:C4-dicarboxylate transporter, DctM subunit|nr:TRAP transporter large permease [Deltaproteobacteria bacterium]MBT4643569.1 TRAP transporter large permease [Deltaproteobacteria bacterium]MBT6611064.1 TRAP transporter large permease [Deltaproteobacteria bacterium]MBT7154252.1 TRAP transporter large permease [Deltaproteobacteria bacterium]MBT7710682.1 TRAP transporter large permease [Deltaproteobacteria bacterium]